MEQFFTDKLNEIKEKEKDTELTKAEKDFIFAYYEYWHYGNEPGCDFHGFLVDCYEALGELYPREDNSEKEKKLDEQISKLEEALETLRNEKKKIHDADRAYRVIIQDSYCNGEHENVILCGFSTNKYARGIAEELEGATMLLEMSYEKFEKLEKAKDLSDALDAIGYIDELYEAKISITNYIEKSLKVHGIPDAINAVYMYSNELEIE